MTAQWEPQAGWGPADHSPESRSVARKPLREPPATPNPCVFVLFSVFVSFFCFILLLCYKCVFCCSKQNCDCFTFPTLCPVRLPDHSKYNNLGKTLAMGERASNFGLSNSKWPNRNLAVLLCYTSSLYRSLFTPSELSTLRCCGLLKRSLFLLLWVCDVM